MNYNNFYIFGTNNGQPKIYNFDLLHNKINEFPVLPQMTILDYMSALRLEKDIILITGGLYDEDNNKFMSDQAYYFNPAICQITQLPQMKQKRYMHNSIFYKGKVFICGGRQLDQLIGIEKVMRHVESFDIVNQVWKTCAPMIESRCLSQLFIYNDKLHICGGLQQEGKRIIEYYNDEKDYWEKLCIKLPYSVQAGLMFSFADDELTFIGGIINDGITNQCFSINLKKQTYITKSSIKHPRIFHKGVFNLNKNQLIIIGGYKDSEIEYCHINQQDNVKYYQLSWKQKESYKLNMPSGFIQEWQSIYVGQKQIGSSTTIESDGNELENNQDEIQNFEGPKNILYNEEQKVQESTININNSTLDIGVYLFGSDFYPFILEIMPKQNKVRIKEVPLNIKLLHFMACCSYDNKGNIFLAGGLNGPQTKISRRCYIYDSQKNQAKKVKKMNYFRFLSSAILCQNFIYICGGRTYQSDNLSMLSTCERYSLEDQKWEMISSMNQAKCSLNCFVCNNDVYVCGGNLGNGIFSEIIERYNSGFNEWQIISLEIKFPTQICQAVSSYDGKILIFGEKTDYQSVSTITMVDLNKVSFIKEIQLKCKYTQLFGILSTHQQICILGTALNQNTLQNEIQVEYIDYGELQNCVQHQLPKNAIQHLKKENKLQNKLSKRIKELCVNNQLPSFSFSSNTTI